LGEADPATVSDFRLDQYEATVSRFRQFVAAWNAGTGWLPSAGAGKHSTLNAGQGLNAIGGGYEPGWDAADDSGVSPTDAHLSCDNYATWTPTVGEHERLPINCVNWYEAYAFCIWDGGFLPTEAEWGFAAAGGDQQREYPWGSTDPGTGNQYQVFNCEFPNGAGPCVDVSNVAPVGTAAQGAGRWGQLDLTGNVEEWALDWYRNPFAGPCTDCAYLTAGSGHSLRGGSFKFLSQLVSVTSRDGGKPDGRSPDYGIRCAREP
jgi:formylglycine-generating enzyme required for sulfatase activity